MKLCPIMTNPTGVETPCIKEKCAWWIESSKACASKVMGQHIENVKDILGEKGTVRLGRTIKDKQNH